MFGDIQQRVLTVGNTPGPEPRVDFYSVFHKWFRRIGGYASGVKVAA
jgi:hypothetical protein